MLFPKFKVTKNGFGKYRVYRRHYLFFYCKIRDWCGTRKWQTQFDSFDRAEEAIVSDIRRRAITEERNAKKQEFVVAAHN